MAVNYATALKDDRMTCVITRLDAQSGVAKIEICTAAYATVLSTISLQKPSFTESGGVITVPSITRKIFSPEPSLM